LSACLKPGLLAALAFIDKQQIALLTAIVLLILKLSSVPIIESY